MTEIVDLGEARLNIKVKKGFKNWASQFQEEFNLSTSMKNISMETLTFLAKGRENSPFYLYDLIMNLMDLGSGFRFNELKPPDKMAVLDRHLFLLDRIRFEYMRRMGWLSGYPGEEIALVELIIRFDQLAPGIQARPAILSETHPAYEEYKEMSLSEREELIRKLIPTALKKMGYDE
jgi:hypothetical protein